MPILDAHSFEFFSRSPEQTRRLGMRLGALLQQGDLICLQGDLGAAKAELGHVAAFDRARVLKACRAAGLEL